MKLVKMYNGQVWNVTSRHADQLVAEGKAQYYNEVLKEAKEEKKTVETKEEKAPRRTKKK
jgi:type III secretion system FlhB-like substrate exporter